MTDLPVGDAPAPVATPHFPSRLHAYIWRNWTLVPLERLAEVVGATPEDLRAVAASLGLPEAPAVSADQFHRSHITLIRRNWHLLPYAQLLRLLDWTSEQLAYVLQEDDFLFIKLGRLKPACEPLHYAAPDAATRQKAEAIGAWVREQFGADAGVPGEPLFRFVEELSRPPEGPAAPPRESRFSPRYCYSYFALYGDPLLEPEADPYPDGYLQRLVAAGVAGVWLQGVLYKLSPFPWDRELSVGWEERLRNLRALVERAARHGIGIYLYLNEPRSMPLAFFAERPELLGAIAGNHAALCTSSPAVQEYMREAVATVCRAVPELAGIFTITASENFTNCWSHHRGEGCARCGPRPAAAVIAEVNSLIAEGIRRSGAPTRLIAWDWGWKDEDAPGVIAALPAEALLMSVSEWSIPIERGGTPSEVGEYSISVVGPGPRARRHWELAKARGLQTMAKIQAGNTWELSAVPYIPAVENVARHIANLRESGVAGLMLGWTLGGYPSPNLEVVAEMGAAADTSVEDALHRVAARRFGEGLAPRVVRAWQAWSRAFSQFPYHIRTVYTAPLQMGPANPLWENPTGYRATMVGLPYDDLTAWRAVFPPEVWISQLLQVADGFAAGVAELLDGLTEAEQAAVAAEARVARAAAVHFRSAAHQAQFVVTRDALAAAETAEAALPLCNELEALLHAETELAVALYEIQRQDSRIGFEATNQYYYVPADLVEKALNCRDLLERWLPAQRSRWTG